MSDRLLPVGSSALEVAAAEACASLQQLPVPLRTLWSPQTCPVALLPYLAWAWSVDRWDQTWPEETKRAVVAASQFVHRRKGTIAAIRRVVEPLGYLIRITEWWKNNAAPGTFSLDIGVLETGITEEMYNELERLIGDARAVSRHLTALTITQDIQGIVWTGAVQYDAETVTIFPA